MSRDCLACGIGIWVLADCADRPLTIDALPQRPSVRPAELPNMWTAHSATSDETPVLHSCLLHRSCDVEEFLRTYAKAKASTEPGSELLCGGNARTYHASGDTSGLPTIRELVAIGAFTRIYAVVPLQTLDQRSGGPLNCR